MRLQDGRVPLWPLHLLRLTASCLTLAIPLPQVTAPTGGDDRGLRLQLGPDGINWTERPLERQEPVTLIISDVEHRPYRHKTTDRGQFIEALEQARVAGADDAVLLTGDGWVAEAAIWSLFWWEGETLCTPPLNLGVLPGVARARLGEMLGGLLERRVRAAALPRAGLFVANAVRGVVPVASLDGEMCADAPATARVRAGFWG